MTIEGNPFDLIQSVSLLSGLAEVYYFITKLLFFFFFQFKFFCQDASSSSSTAINLSLSANKFFSVIFKDFSLGSEIPACVYWDDTETTWTSEG